MGSIKFYLNGDETTFMNACTSIHNQIKLNQEIVNDDQILLKFLENPVMVQLKGTAWKQMVVSTDEPEFVTDLKIYLVQELKRNGLSPHLQLEQTKGIKDSILIPSQPRKIDL